MARGKTYTTISKELGIGRTTIWKYRQEMGELPIVDELIRIQMDEIDACDSAKLRMQYRSELIRCLRPLKHEAKIESDGRLEIVVVKPE